MLRLPRFQPLMSAVVLPLVAVKLFTPSVRVAPSGICEMPTERLSEPSVSFSEAVRRDSGMLLSSSPSLAL